MNRFPLIASWPLIPALVSTAAVTLPLALFTGCAEQPIEHTVRKVSIEIAPDEKPAAESQARAFTTLKAKVEKELAASLDKLDAEIQELKARSANLKADAQARLDKAVADIAAKQEAARQKLDELKNASAETWERLEHEAKAAWQELERAVTEAMKEPKEQARERAAADRPRRL